MNRRNGSLRAMWMIWRMRSLPGLSLGWALPEKIICTGLPSLVSRRASRSGSERMRLARL